MERLKDFYWHLRRTFCRHHDVPVYDETRNEYDDGMVYWSAHWDCPLCGEVLGVLATYSGDPKRIAEGLKGEDLRGHAGFKAWDLRIWRNA